MPEWNSLPKTKMHGQTLKHGWNEEQFFRSEQIILSDNQSMANDEPLAQPKPIHEPLECGSQQELTLVHQKHKSHRNIKTGKTKRGYGRKNGKLRNNKTNFSLLGVNCNGILNKQASLLNSTNTFKPSIVTLQETKVRKSGRLKLKGYQIFEKVRKDGIGGGLLTAADENLNPVLISTGKEDDSEILTVQVKAGKHEIRIINAYGPQEDESNLDEIYRFWQEIEEEITNAKDDDCMIIIQLDANTKIGKKHLKNDSNDETPNGRILIDIVERQNMTIANTMELGAMQRSHYKREDNCNQNRKIST